MRIPRALAGHRRLLVAGLALVLLAGGLLVWKRATASPVSYSKGHEFGWSLRGDLAGDTGFADDAARALAARPDAPAQRWRLIWATTFTPTPGSRPAQAAVFVTGESEAKQLWTVHRHAKGSWQVAPPQPFDQEAPLAPFPVAALVTGRGDRADIYMAAEDVAGVTRLTAGEAGGPPERAPGRIDGGLVTFPAPDRSGPPSCVEPVFRVVRDRIETHEVYTGPWGPRRLGDLVVAERRPNAFLMGGETERLLTAIGAAFTSGPCAGRPGTVEPTKVGSLLGVTLLRKPALRLTDGSSGHLVRLTFGASRTAPDKRTALAWVPADGTPATISVLGPDDQWPTVPDDQWSPACIVLSSPRRSPILVVVGAGGETTLDPAATRLGGADAVAATRLEQALGRIDLYAWDGRDRAVVTRDAGGRQLARFAVRGPDGTD